MTELFEARPAEGVGDEGRGVADQQRGLQRQSHAVDYVARAVFEVAQIAEIPAQASGIFIYGSPLTRRSKLRYIGIAYPARPIKVGSGETDRRAQTEGA